jgi:hypothetical protein
VLAFFGLTPSIRLQIFREIHEIVFHGGGGYDWHTIYNMPTWLRKTTFNFINEHFEKINEERDKTENVLTNKTDITTQKIAKPGVLPQQSPSTQVESKPFKK